MRVKRYDEIPTLYREGTSDERALVEVVEKKCYRRPSIGFDVEAGERWLDLGANIGAFAIYCRLRGATCESYEPDSKCFTLLKKNVRTESHNIAVTHLEDEFVEFWQGDDPKNFYRGGVIKRLKKMTAVGVTNRYVGQLGACDGIKMDIEGAEFGILDNKLLPWCNKLVLEYHSSVEPSASGLAKRLAYLKSLFDVVSYPAELDRKMQAKDNTKTYFDRLIFCMGNKKPSPIH